MNENTLALIAFLKLVWVSCFSYLYSLGGIEGKWKRRFLGSAWMILGIFGFSQWQGCWNNWYLLCFPLMTIGLSMGYGANDTFTKIRKRAIYGLILGCSSIPIVVFSHMWVLFGFSVFLSVISCVVLGVFNPTKDARSEETLIATLCLLLTLFLI